MPVKRVALLRRLDARQPPLLPAANWTEPVLNPRHSWALKGLIHLQAEAEECPGGISLRCVGYKKTRKSHSVGCYLLMLWNLHFIVVKKEIKREPDPEMSVIPNSDGSKNVLSWRSITYIITLFKSSLERDICKCLIQDFPCLCEKKKNRTFFFNSNCPPGNAVFCWPYLWLSGKQNLG